MKKIRIKKAVIAIIACLLMTGCRENNPNLEEQVNAAIAKAIDEGTLAVVDKTNSEDKKDTLENSLIVNEYGELVLEVLEEDKPIETSTPGEAILSSTTLSSGFFSNAKLAREQTRAKNKQALLEIVEDINASDEQKQAAIDCIIQMTEAAEMENAAELLLEAKGFEGVVVNIVDGNVDVVVNAEYITDSQIAQIEDIVMRKTGAAPDKIVITSVVVEE